NILVIIVITATKGYHSMTSLFIINLAISDCLVGLGVMPFVALSLLYEDWSKINELCLFVGYVSSVYCTASILSVVAVSLDRYWAIVDCMKYETPWSTQRSLCIITWIWVQAAITCCPPLLGWSKLVYVPSKYTCTIDWATSTSYTMFFSTISFFIPTTIFIYCFIRIVIIAIVHAKQIRILQNQLQRNSPRKKTSEVEKPTCSQLIYIVNCKLLTDAHSCDNQSVCSFNPDLLNPKHIKKDLFSENDFYGRDRCGRLRLIFMVAVFLCCWVPYVIINMIQAIETTTLQQPTAISSPVLTTAYWLTLLNSDFNPLLYALLSRRFQKALKILLRKVCKKDSLSDVPHSLQRRRTSSNVTGISNIHYTSDQQSQGENSCASASPVPSRHSSQQEEDYIPGQFPNPPSELISSNQEIQPETENSCVLLNPSNLQHQFLQVPTTTSYQIRLPTTPSGKRSTLVCGNITIKVSYEDH
ncbi:5-hydroxytryptamine receptor 1D-like, partial [Pelobates cultripes]